MQKLTGFSAWMSREVSFYAEGTSLFFFHNFYKRMDIILMIFYTLGSAPDNVKMCFFYIPNQIKACSLAGNHNGLNL